MGRFAPLFALLLAVTGAQAEPSPARLPRVELYGQAYVKLVDWARAQNFTVRYTPASPVVNVTNRWARLRFETDSRKAVIDGITVHLSHPVAKRYGDAHIALVDLQTAIHPILFPVKNAPGRRVRTVCLDAGHGGKDAGNLEGRQQEKVYTLKLTMELKQRLEAAGLNVVLTRGNDAFVELYERPEIARRRGADLFVSLHFNSAAAEARGSEVYCLTPAGATSTNARGEGAGTGAYPGNKFNEQNALLAYQVQKRLERDLGVEDRGVRRARFAVLKEAQMPAVLIEGGFMSHPAEGRKITDPGYLRQMAGSIADALLAYKRLVERSPESTPSTAAKSATKKSNAKGGPATASTR